MDEGFVKGQSDNLPNIDIYTVMDFFSSNPSYVRAEIKGVKLFKKAYTMNEMKSIVHYLVEHKAYSEIRGRKMWMDFASSKETNRTWQSLKETFLKRILPDINNPYYNLSIYQIASFRSESDVETKCQNKLDVEPVDKDISSKENGHSKIKDIEVEVNTEQNKNKEGTSPGEEPIIPQNIIDNRASTDTLVLEQCYETAEDIQKDLEQSDKEEATADPADDAPKTSAPIPANLVQVLKDFTSDDENNDEVQKAVKKSSNNNKTKTESPIEISDSEEKVISSESKPKKLADEKHVDNPKNTSNSILSENDAETVKNCKNIKEKLPDKSKTLTQNSSNTTVDTQLPNNPEELNKNNDKSDINKKSKAQLSLNDRKRNRNRTTSESAPTKRAKFQVQQSISDTDAVQNIKSNEVITEQATRSEQRDKSKSNDAQIVNVDDPLDTNVHKSAEVDKNTSPVVNMVITPQIENPCLKSVNLYEEQFSCTIYSDSDDVQIDKKFESKKITENVRKPQTTSKRKALVIHSNSNPSSTSEGQTKNKSGLRIIEKKQRDKALAHTFGFSSNAVFGNRKRRHSYTKRRSTSHHRILNISSDSSDSSSETESEFISPPRARKNRGTKKYLKPKSARVLSLEEEGGLFVMHGKKIYPVVKDGKILKNYLTYESDEKSDKETSYWKLKYVEEKKKSDELEKLLKQVSNPKTVENSVVPEATTTTDLDVRSENSKKQQEIARDSKSTDTKEEKTVKIKITKNNEEVELEGHWTHINPVLQQVVQMMKKNGQSTSENQMPPPGNEQATGGLRQSTSDPVTHSGVSTPVEKVKSRINAIESEIFKEIEELDKVEKEPEPEQPVEQSKDTAQRRSGRKKSPLKKVSVSSPKSVKADEEDKTAGAPERPVTRRSLRMPKQVVSENIQENAVKTRKGSPRTASSAETEVRYKFPSAPRPGRRARYTIKTARIYSSPDNLSLNSEETTQGYVDSDGSPAICLRKKRKSCLNSRKVSNHIRKKSIPSITEDLSSESSVSFVTAPLQSKTFTNSSLSSQIYRSDSYQLLVPKTKDSSKRLDQIDELSLNSNDGEILHSNSNEANDTENNNIESQNNLNVSKYNVDTDLSYNMSLPTSPVLSIVENMSINKSLLSNVSENFRENTNRKVTLNELMSEADVSMPLMERNYTVKKKSEDGTKYHYSLQEPSITDSFINKICTVQIEDISDSISSKLRNLLIESAKKIATKIKTSENDKNVETAAVIEEPVVKAKKSKTKKRSSTPRKRTNVGKRKASIPEPYIEEHTEACSLAGRRSCPPIVHVTDVDQTINDKQQNQETKKVSELKEKKKKDIIKVKITKPSNKKKSKEDYKEINHGNKENTPNGNGTNDTESGIFLQGLNDSVDLIHNHSDTCLQAQDCIHDRSVEIIEPSPKSVIMIDSNSNNVENELSHCLHVNEKIALELMSNDAQDGTDLIKVLNSAKSKSIDTTTASALNTTATSRNSLITEDLSFDALNGTPRSNNWYLLSEEENTTNFKDLNQIEPISLSYGANMQHIFPVAYAVPNLSTVTEMSKDGDTDSINVNIP